MTIEPQVTAEPADIDCVVPTPMRDNPPENIMNMIAEPPNDARRIEPACVKFDEMHLPIGVRMQMMVGPANQQYATSLVGYVRGEYLIVRIPVVNGLSIALRQGESIKMRVFSGVSVFMFTTHIEHFLLGGLYLLLLSFPKSIQATTFRNATRVPVQVEAQVTPYTGPVRGVATPTVIRDLSMHGALVTSASALGATDDEIAMSFTLTTQSSTEGLNVSLKAFIRNVQTSGGNATYRYGVEFETLQNNNKLYVQEFLYEHMLDIRRPPA
jgi:c-di-GMP-binding flagellar brake protein YcgR